MSKQKNLIAVLFIALMSVALAACNAAQAGGLAAPTTQTGSVVSGGGITVVGQGTAYGQPDQANVVVGVESFAATVAEATTQNQTCLLYTSNWPKILIDTVTKVLYSISISRRNDAAQNTEDWSHIVAGTVTT